MDIYSDSTPDLVDKVFGKIASVRLASFVLLAFLYSNLLTVEVDGKELIREEWPEACACAGANSTTVDPSSDVTKRYLWKWCEVLDEGTKHGVEIFFNVVGLAAYIVAMTTGAAEELRNRKVTTRFATLPSSYGPLFNPTSPCSSSPLPHFFALPSTSFVSKNTQSASGRPDEFLEMASPLCIIKEKFPFILNRFSHIFPDIMDSIEDFSQTRLLTASSQISNLTAPSDSTASIREELIAFAASLEADPKLCASPQVEQVLCEYSQRRFLDLSRICAPEVLLLGVITISINADRMRTMMQCQRRSQPWLRSLWSLAINEDELGLFRADAVGLQEYTFDRLTGFGVIQSIQVALGITVATNEELGIHPAFSFREAVSKPFSEPGQERTTSNGDADMPPYKKVRKECSGIPRPRLYRYKEVNFCSLENRSLRTSNTPHVNAAEPKIKYYVRYLLKDERSLFGRSTRVWCVYKEVLDEERGKYPQTDGVTKTSPLFVNPFALKMYNADVNHEAYKFDLVQRAIDANVRYVVLPKHIWYLGKVVQDLRPGGCLRMDDSELDDRIESLADAGLMHCDVSIDNILLEAEPYSVPNEVIDFVTFTTDGTADTEIALLFQPSGSHGGLHDLDLLERVSGYQKSVRGQEKFNRVGTLPFMSIECIKGQKHVVIDDVHSLFYVLYLSMFQLAGPVPNCYPSAPTEVAFEYPEEVKDWAADESPEYGWTKEQLFAHVKAMKTHFFERQRKDMSYPPWYFTAATQSLPFWRDNFAIHRVFLAAFHEDLWFEAASIELEIFWVRRRQISPRKLIEKLEEYEGTLKDMLKDLK
ncbi:hypothetical protein C0995_012178 [Termitomyces sp. Mi166|nr:hypothetical protein C0995_012178 [Termitomyces sp. Mi166\